MESIDLQAYIRPLKKWWWLIALATLIAAASSFVYSSMQPDLYRANATISVGNAMQELNPNNSNFYAAEQLAGAYADIAKRDTIRQATMEALGLTWLPLYTADVVPNTQLVEIAVLAGSPELAQAVANELVNQLIGQSPAGREQQDRQAFVMDRLAKLETSIIETEVEIERKQDELTGLFRASQIADVQRQLEKLQDKLADLETNYATLLTNTGQGAVNAVNVLEYAALPPEPVPNNLLINVLLAAIVGLVLAMGAAYLIEFLDDSVRSGSELKRRFGLTVLGRVPVIDNGRKDRASKLVMATNRQDPVSEAYRMLRTNLQFAAVGHNISRLLVTSAEPSDGKSVTAANLSAALAYAGRSVVLVDADLHRPQQHKHFQISNGRGLTTALMDVNVSIESILQETIIPGLRVLTSGPLPPNAAELLSSARMEKLREELNGLADIVVFDSPPVNAVTDPAVLAASTDSTVFVTRYGKTRNQTIRRALDTLEHIGARVAGVVVNDIPLKKIKTGKGYGYGSYGSYGSQGQLRGLWPFGRNRDQSYGQMPAPAPVPAPMPASAMQANSVTVHAVPQMNGNGNGSSIFGTVNGVNSLQAGQVSAHNGSGANTSSSRASTHPSTHSSTRHLPNEPHSQNGGSVAAYPVQQIDSSKANKGNSVENIAPSNSPYNWQID